MSADQTRMFDEIANGICYICAFRDRPERHAQPFQGCLILWMFQIPGRCPGLGCSAALRKGTSGFDDSSVFHPRESVACKNHHASNYGMAVIQVSLSLNQRKHSAHSAPRREHKIKRTFRLLMGRRRRSAPRNVASGKK